MKLIHTILITALLRLTCAATAVFAAEDPHDIVVYGGTSGGVVVSNAGTTGAVITDAVQFLPDER